MNDFDEMPTMNVIHLLALKDNRIWDLHRENNVSKEVLRELYFQIGQDMDINPSAKTVYLSKIAFANNSLKGNQ